MGRRAFQAMRGGLGLKDQWEQLERLDCLGTRANRGGKVPSDQPVREGLLVLRARRDQQVQKACRDRKENLATLEMQGRMGRRERSDQSSRTELGHPGRLDFLVSSSGLLVVCPCLLWQCGACM